jgi:DNA-binding transcriptional ArsR family regulator
MTDSPQGEYLISDFETLKVVADPLRAQIFELLVQDTHTVAQAAEKLGLGASKLYYHFGLLEKVGLIKVVGTRQVRNMVEKDYRAAYDTIDVAPSLLNFSTTEGQENLQAMLAATLDATRDDILRSVQARLLDLERGAAPIGRRLMLTRETSRISVARAEAFYERLAALVKEFSAAENEPAGDPPHPYALVVALYPSFYYREPDGET